MLFIANWKMHGSRDFIAKWTSLFQPPPDVQTVVCPPDPYLTTARQHLPEQIAVGAQNISIHPDDGPHTGEMSARMLADCGGQYTLIGHSERRAQGETDQHCRQKILAAREHHITPILCIGETSTQRDNQHISSTLTEQLSILPPFPATPTPASATSQTSATPPHPHSQHPRHPPLIIAYEPVWAIGTGKTPSVDDLVSVRNIIREQLSAQLGDFSDIISLLYGGSIGAGNASMLVEAGLDGGLVGGASLDAEVFADICHRGSRH